MPWDSDEDDVDAAWGHSEEPRGGDVRERDGDPVESAGTGDEDDQDGSNETDALPLDVDWRQFLLATIQSLGVVAAGFVLAAIVTTIGLVALGVESTEALTDRPRLFGAMTAVGFLGFVAAALVFVATREDRDVVHWHRPVPKDLGFVIVGVIVLYVTNLGASVALAAASAFAESVFGSGFDPGTHEYVRLGSSNPELFLVMIPVSLFVVGPAEELLFRGVVQGLFRKVTGPVVAIAIASSLFGLAHFSASSGGDPVTYLVVAGVLGVVLGGLYEYTETILVPAAVHGSWNALVFAAQWAQATGALPAA